MSSTLHYMVTGNMGSSPVASAFSPPLLPLPPFIPHSGHSRLSRLSSGTGLPKARLCPLDPAPVNGSPHCTPPHPTLQPKLSGTAQIPAHMAPPQRWNWGPRVGAIFTHVQPLLLSLSPDPRTSGPGLVSQAGEGSRGEGLEATEAGETKSCLGEDNSRDKGPREERHKKCCGTRRHDPT